MMINLEFLREDPARFFEFTFYRIIAVLIALVMHEVSHGYAAYRLGDPTAKQMGRLSLNPLRHMDPIGTLMMFFLGFGYAKPVPINPNYFKRPHRDDLIVSLAGITTNLIIFLITTVAAFYVNAKLWHPAVLAQYTARELIGLDGMALNVILVGYGNEFRQFFARPELLPVLRMLMQIAVVNLSIAVFNLLPVPPLDGSHVVNDLLFKGNLFVRRHIAQIGSGLLLLLSFSGVLGRGLGYVNTWIQGGLLDLLSLMGG